MTNRRAGRLGAAVLTILCSVPLMAQVSSVPPTITAENETWYLSGGPVSLNGAVYYPAGAVIHFVRNEMVRTGIVGTTPVYARTTQEPGSIIYVPLAGGLMRPYERRRSGELAGTSGSSAPSFVVSLPAAEAADVGGLQAPAPPTGVPIPVGTAGVAQGAPDAAAAAPVPPAGPAPVGTSGLMQVSSKGAVRTRIETAEQPVGLNNVFVEFQNARWFAAGPAVEFSSSRFTRVGEHRGFAVYQESGRTGTIYLSLLDGAPGLLTPYKTR